MPCSDTTDGPSDRRHSRQHQWRALLCIYHALKYTAVILKLFSIQLFCGPLNDAVTRDVLLRNMTKLMYEKLEGIRQEANVS